MHRTDGPIVAPGQRRVVDVAGDRYFLLAEGQGTAGRYALLEAVVTPGGGPPPHVHSREHEAFYVLEGQITFTVDDRQTVVLPGTSAHLAPGVPHTFRNEGDAPARMLILVSPAGLEQMFLRVGDEVSDLSTPITPMGPDQVARLLAAAPEYGIEILVPH